MKELFSKMILLQDIIRENLDQVTDREGDFLK